MRQKLSFQGVFTRGDAGTPFRYLPFEVPDGAQRIEVAYHFDVPEAERPDVVDIGLFDQRGVDFLEGGFRGWSGSARAGFFVGKSEATPGYVRGPLSPGEWNVLLGCPLRAVDQARYWVDVSIDVDPAARDAHGAPTGDPDVASASTTSSEPAQRTAPGRWYRGDFHSHTVHSDGYNSIDEYVAEAVRRGLDFLAITDHNTASHFDEIAGREDWRVLLIPGEEVTTAWGHANVWGTGGWVDFRCTDDEGMQRIVDFVHGRGGLFSPNHPKDAYPWEFAGVEDFRVVEAWQGPWRFNNTMSLEFWERRLRTGRQIVAVGGSDCHSIAPAVVLHPWTLGDPCTWVYVQGSLDEQGVLAGVRAGHVFVSEDPTGPFLELTASCDGRAFLMGDTIAAPAGSTVRLRLHYRGPQEKKLRLLKDGELWQQVVAEQDDCTVEFELPLEQPGYVRAEVMGLRGRPERGEVVHALSNPLYLRPEDAR